MLTPFRHLSRIDRPLAVAAMVLAAVLGAGVVTESTTVETPASAIAVALAAYLLWRASIPLLSGASRPAVLVVLTLAAVLPEYIIDIHFAWSGAGSAETEGAPYALSGATGTNSLLIGLAWPLLAVLSLRGGGKWVVLEPDRRIALWMLLLASLYAFTIFLKGFLSLFDTVFRTLLLGAYLLDGGQENRVAGYRRLSGVGKRPVHGRVHRVARDRGGCDRRAGRESRRVGDRVAPAIPSAQVRGGPVDRLSRREGATDRGHSGAGMAQQGGPGRLRPPDGPDSPPYRAAGIGAGGVPGPRDDRWRRRQPSP